MTLYKPRNMVGSTIASGSNFVHGTDSQITLTDAGDFDGEGGYIRIDDGSQWSLYEYTGINSNTLTGLSASDYIAESTASHTFSEGTPVTLEATADLWRDIVSIFRGDMTWALHKFSNITGIESFKSDIAANLSAGIADRICFEEDTGRVLYDNGASFVELGLSESQIGLGNLGSLDALGNSITNQSTSWSDFNNLDLSNVSNFDQANFISVDQADVELADGDSLQLFRTHLPTGKAIKIIRAGVAQKDGTYGTASLDIEVYNQTDSSSIYSFDSSGTTTEGLDEGSYSSPLATGGTGDQVIIRLKNDTGSTQEFHGFLTAVVE